MQNARSHHTWHNSKRYEGTHCQTSPHIVPHKNVRGYRLSDLTTHGTTQKGARMQIFKPHHTWHNSKKCEDTNCQTPTTHGTNQKGARIKIFRLHYTQCYSKTCKDTECQTSPYMAPLKKKLLFIPIRMTKMLLYL